jgi:glycosyltransferase involved in cell wall biosynthesis
VRPMDALFSIVITTRNEETNIGRLLQSIALSGFEMGYVVVVDNHSTDMTGRIVAECGARLVLAGPERSAQRNIGVEACSTEYVMVLDADMEVSSALLDEVTELISTRRPLSIVMPEVSVGDGWIVAARKAERSRYTDDLSICAARVFKVSEFLKAGGYDLRVTGPEDWWIARKIYEVEAPTCTTEPIGHHEGRLGVRSVARKFFKYGKGYYGLFRANKRYFIEHVNPLRPALLKQSRSWNSQRRDLALIGAYKMLTYSAGLAGFTAAAIADFWRARRGGKPAQ